LPRASAFGAGLLPDTPSCVRALVWLKETKLAGGASGPKTAAACRIQSLSVTSAIFSQEGRCLRPTDSAAFMSSQRAPRSSPRKSPPSSK
jgi:hypothetical protein